MRVKDVAERLGVTESTVRFGLREGKFPFGTAFKQSDRWTYVIYPKIAEDYLGRREG